MVGGDDAKYHDNKRSDVGEVSSPSVGGTKIDDGGDGSAVSVEREFKIEDGTSEKNGKFEHDETSRKSSYDGGSSGSSGSGSSSSSDDESHGIKSSQAAVHVIPVADSVMVADPFSGEHVEVIDNSHIEGASSSIVENTTPAVPTIVESVFNENGEKKESTVEEHVGVPEASNDAASQEKEALIPSAENIVENIAQENDDQLNLSCNVPVAAADNGRDSEKDSGVTEVHSRFGFYLLPNMIVSFHF